MDPEKALQEIRQICKDAEPDVQRLVDLFEGLDHWILKGGYLPTEWAPKSIHIPGVGVFGIKELGEITNTK